MMGIGRFLAGTTLAAGVGLVTYLALTKQDPVTWGNHLKQQAQHTADQVNDVRQAKDNLSKRTAQLSAALTAAEPVLADIQTDVNKFAFKAAPRISAIQEILDQQDAE